MDNYRFPPNPIPTSCFVSFPELASPRQRLTVETPPMSDQPTKELSLQDLPELRRKTNLVAKLLTEQLAAHLETLRPLFAPDRLFGKYAGGKAEVHGSDLALAELQQKYKPFTSKPYDLPNTFETNWLTLVGGLLDVRPWEYSMAIQDRTITMSSPVKWLLCQRSSVGLVQLRSVMAGKERTRLDELRQTVVNTLVLQLILRRHPGIAALFRDLRFEISIESVADFPGLPVVTVTSCFSSFRPADDLVLAATAFSGVLSFIELIDLDALRKPKDLLREKIEELLH